MKFSFPQSYYKSVGQSYRSGGRSYHNVGQNYCIVGQSRKTTAASDKPWDKLDSASLQLIRGSHHVLDHMKASNLTQCSPRLLDQRGIRRLSPHAGGRVGLARWGMEGQESALRPNYCSSHRPINSCPLRNRGLAASQPISVAGREIEEPASRFPSNRNWPDFFSPPAAVLPPRLGEGGAAGCCAAVACPAARAARR